MNFTEKEKRYLRKMIKKKLNEIDNGLSVATSTRAMLYEIQHKLKTEKQLKL